MTEDDTFDRLRRIPFEQMLKIWGDSPMTASTPGFEKLFESHGWPWPEYLEAHYKAFRLD